MARPQCFQCQKAGQCNLFALALTINSDCAMKLSMAEQM
jgi:hypothetical protein